MHELVHFIVSLPHILIMILQFLPHINDAILLH